MPWGVSKAAWVGSRAAAFALAVSACSLLLDLRREQCASDDDCGGPRSRLVCRASSCVAPTDVTAGDGAVVDSGELPCESNRKCTEKLNSPAICDKRERKRICVQVGTEDCPIVVPASAFDSDDVVLFGGFTAIKNGDPQSQPPMLAFQLALNELKNGGGLPPFDASPARSIAGVFCANDRGPEGNDRALNHLIGTLHVGAIVSAFEHDVMPSIADRTNASDVFLLNPLDTTAALHGGLRNEKELLWQLLGPVERVAEAYVPLLRRVDRYVRRSDFPSPLPLDEIGRPLNVAIVTEETPMRQAVRDWLTALDWESEFKSVFVGPQLFRAEPYSATVSYDALVQQIAGGRPDVVIMLTSAQTDSLMLALDELMASENRRLPFYVLSVGNAFYGYRFINEARDGVARTTPNKVKRLAGITYAGSADPAQKAKFLRSMSGAYPSVDKNSYAATENAYDAFYWLSYGLFAARSGGEPTGPEIQRGVRSLLGGKPIYPGNSTDLNNAFTAMASGADVEFVGALGKPDFDEHGAALSVGAAYCYRLLHSPNPRENLEIVYDVRRYAAGELHAPPASSTQDGGRTEECLANFW